jgi:hypothetical protein
VTDIRALHAAEIGSAKPHRPLAMSRAEDVGGAAPLEEFERGAPDRGSFPAFSGNGTVEENRGLVLASKTLADLVTQMKIAALATNAVHTKVAIERVGGHSEAPHGEAESSVHVTIGKIEVRVVEEKKQVSRNRAPSPVMSLEDYLHQRSQRGGH